MTPPHVTPRLVIMLASAVMLAVVVSGCNSGSKASDLPLVTAATSLPLQANAQAVGGDPQSDFTDVASASITDQQAKDFAELCGGPLDLEQDPTCQHRVVEMGVLPCKSHMLCVVVSHQGDLVLVRIVDQRQSKPLCGSGPGGLCLQTSVERSALRPDVLDQLPGLGTATPTDTTSPSGGAGSTDTESSSLPPTSPESPTVSPTDSSSPRSEVDAASPSQ
jgi:hypothetical protein